MSTIAADEISVLSSIYCGKDEFQLLEESGRLQDQLIDSQRPKMLVATHSYSSLVA